MLFKEPRKGTCSFYLPTAYQQRFHIFNTCEVRARIFGVQRWKCSGLLTLVIQLINLFWYGRIRKIIETSLTSFTTAELRWKGNEDENTNNTPNECKRPSLHWRPRRRPVAGSVSELSANVDFPNRGSCQLLEMKLTIATVRWTWNGKDSWETSNHHLSIIIVSPMKVTRRAAIKKPSGWEAVSE